MRCAAFVTMALLLPKLACAADSPLATQLRACLDRNNGEAELKQCVQPLLDADDARLASAPQVSPQPKLQETPKQIADRADKLIYQGLEPSYVTPSAGLRMGGDHSPGNLLYEAQIVSNFSLHRWSHQEGRWNMRVDVPVRLEVRQLTSDSKPVRTPSYNPGLRLYAYPDDALQYLSFGAFHYSNGQDGVSYNPDGSVNTVNGSFSTNYLELAYARSFDSNAADGSWRLSFRNDFYGTWDKAQQYQYPRRQLELQASLPIPRTDLLLRLATRYRAGFGYVVYNPVQPGLNQPARFGDHWQQSLQLWCKCKPIFDEDVRVYLRYDLGHDDYNINFQNRINRLMVGLAAPIP